MDLCSAFTLYMQRSQTLSENTLASYNQDISLFMRYIGAEDAVLLSVTQADIEGYIASLRDAGRATTTISRAVASLKKFYRYLYETGLMDQNPTLGLEAPRVERKLPNVLTTAQVVKLLNQPKCTDLKGYRDKAMLELMYATGLKVSEMIALNVSDVDYKEGSLRCASGAHPRMVPMGKVSGDAVRAYLEHARPMLVQEQKQTVLFLNLSGAPLTRQGFWKIVKHYIEAAGISDDVTPQTLRHSFAVHLLQNGADLTSVGEMLGHSGAPSTQVYYKIMKNNVKQAYKKAHPRA